MYRDFVAKMIDITTVAFLEGQFVFLHLLSGWMECKTWDLHPRMISTTVVFSY
jgi:hypothetical protein